MMKWNVCIKNGIGPIPYGKWSMFCRGLEDLTKDGSYILEIYIERKANVHYNEQYECYGKKEWERKRKGALFSQWTVTVRGNNTTKAIIKLKMQQPIM